MKIWKALTSTPPPLISQTCILVPLFHWEYSMMCKAVDTIIVVMVCIPHQTMFNSTVIWKSDNLYSSDFLAQTFDLNDSGAVWCHNCATSGPVLDHTPWSIQCAWMCVGCETVCTTLKFSLVTLAQRSSLAASTDCKWQMLGRYRAWEQGQLNSHKHRT